MVGQTAYGFVCCTVAGMCLKACSSVGRQSGRKGLPWPDLARHQASCLRVLIVYTPCLSTPSTSLLRAVPWQKRKVCEAELGSTSPSTEEEIAMWQRWLMQKDPCSQSIQQSKRSLNSRQPWAVSEQLLKEAMSIAFHFNILIGMVSLCWLSEVKHIGSLKMWWVWYVSYWRRIFVGGVKKATNVSFARDVIGEAGKSRLWNALGRTTPDFARSSN